MAEANPLGEMARTRAMKRERRRELLALADLADSLAMLIRTLRKIQSVQQAAFDGRN
jgi:hypothetical protein